MTRLLSQDACDKIKPRYPLDSDLSGGQRYPAFEQPGPCLYLFPGIKNFLRRLLALAKIITLSQHKRWRKNYFDKILC